MAKRKSSAVKLDGIIAEAYKRFQFAVEQESDNHKRAEEAIKFRDLEQWPDKVKKAREEDPEGPRPCLVLDKINQYINQIKNDQRQNRPSIKVRPVDDKADPKVAKVLQGLIRNIEDVSRAGVSYDTAHEQAVDGGFGYWRILADYVDDTSFDQEPRIVRIRNRFSVLLDPNHQQPDGSDSKWGFVFEKLSHDEFEAQYPGKKKVSYEEYSGVAEGWVEEDSLIVAEYFKVVETREEIAELADGSVVQLAEVPKGQKPVKTRKAKRCKVEWRKLTAAEELDFRELPGRYIPIVQVIGNEIDFKGKRRLSGAIRGAMDAQRMYNYSGSAFVERVALEPRVPWIAAEGQLEGRETEWKTANRRNISVLQYKPVVDDGSGTLFPPPQRQPMPGIPAGWQQLMANSEHDVQTALGMYGSNLGADTDATSGKQELALQRRGDTATFHYQDNLSLAIQHTGRILLEWIPTYYDTAKIVRILGEDGKEDYVRIDPELEAAIKTIKGEDGNVDYYNLSWGRYDVTPVVGPSHVTKRLEAQDFASQMAQAAKDPITSQIMTYLAIKNSDWAGAEEATRMIKATLPPQIQESEEPTDLPPEVSQAIQMAQAQIQQKEQQIMMAAEELDKMKQASQGDIQKAAQLKAEIEKQAQALQSEKQILQLTKQLAEAQLVAKSVEQKAAIDDAITTVRDLISKHEAQISALLQSSKEGEQEGQKQAQSEAVMGQVMQSHQELMQGIGAVLQAMTAPKTKRVVGPNGVYEMTEQLA